MPQPEQQYLLFDFDGVIVDTFKISYSIAKSRDGDLSEDVYRSFFNGNVYEITQPKMLISQTAELSAGEREWFDHYNPQLMARDPVPGMAEAINELGSRYRLSVVSSTISSPIREYLEKHGLAHNFTDILGADVHKSKKEKILMILRKYELKTKQCLFITDTLGDMREATKVGLESIGVTWGFHEVERLQQGSPMSLIHQPAELVAGIDDAFRRLG
ncbi:MAG: HAD family hydrolase [Parcubacteria group bacterium]|nr:HAD family hydrolase [Parcubacteria group bacterium]